jgi:hypothetical protein
MKLAMKEDLDQLRCQTPNCSCDGRILILSSKCSCKGAGLEVAYDVVHGAILVQCAACHTEVLAFAVASRGGGTCPSNLPHLSRSKH